MESSPPNQASQRPSTCTRCGTFADGLVTLIDHQLCSNCVGRAVATGYWSARYLKVIGALLNPTAAMVLLSMNLARLGDAKRARQWGIGAAVMGLVYVALMAVDLPIPNSVFLGAGVAAGISIGTVWEPTWNVLESRGAKRASPWVPPVVALVVLIAAIVVVAVLAGDA